MAQPTPAASAALDDAPGPDSGPSVFVSYASRDRRRALKLVEALEDASVGAWIDIAGIAGGHSYGPEIVAAIRASSALLLLCSAASLTSRNVRQEIQLAWRFGRPILPLRLEPVEFPDSLAYWLEGAQWIDVLDRPPARWLRQVLQALRRFVTAPGRAERPGPDQSTPAVSLPVPPTPLLGRERELADLRRRLAEGARLMTLTGPGGTGKTRLAVELAHAIAGEFPQGAAFVDLAPVADPGRVLPAIAETLGVRETADVSLADQLQNYLQPRRQLLVLDNFEQVAAAAPDIADLLATAPELVILVTSRASLRVRGEREFAVEPLALPQRGEVMDLTAASPAALAVTAASPAVALFLERSRAVGTEVTLSAANVQTVSAIVRRLDGLPLAIELAAARSKIFPPEALLKRLERRLPLLTGGALDLPERQQTLRGTIAWSYDLLSLADQMLLRRLAVFPGGASFEAVEAVAAPNGEIDLFEGLAALVRQSLLRQVRTEGEPRFSMLETIREFALERLEADAEGNDIRRRHAQFYLALAERTEPALQVAPELTWLNRLEVEHDNLRAALTWTLANDVPTAFRLGAGLALFWQVRGHLSEGRLWLERAIAVGDGAEPALRARVLLAAGDLAEIQRDFPPATAALKEALDLFRAQGDLPNAARALRCLGHVAVDQRDYGPATEWYTESLALWREVGDEREVATGTAGLAAVAFYQGNYERATELWTDAASLYRSLGDNRRLGILLNNLGSVAWAHGELDRAVQFHEESLALVRESGDQPGIAASLTNLGIAVQVEGDHERARILLEEALQRYRELGIPGAVATPLYFLAWQARERGETSRAVALVGEAVAASHTTRGSLWVGHSFELLAALAADLGQAARGARLLGAAATLLETAGVEYGVPERTFHDRATAAVRAGLSAEAMAEQFAAGQALTSEEATVEAIALAAELATAGHREST